MNISNDSGENQLKRKLSSFNIEWKCKYFFRENGGDAQCVICKKRLLCKKFNVKRHYEKFHESYDSYVGELRTNLFNKLGSSFDGSSKKDLSVDGLGALRVGYAIVYKMVLGNHPFSDGDFIKDCILEAVGTLSNDEKHKYEEICLSRRTIARRVQDLADDSENQLKRLIPTFVSMSLAIDESTDICDIAQLAVFVRGVDIDLNITEELLQLIPMNGTTTGEDIFNPVLSCADNMGLDWSKVHCVATDGAKAMTGNKNGFVGKLREKFALQKLDDIIAVHCFVHQEALCAKRMTFKNVMDIVIKCVNIIRSHGLNHRQFKQFLETIASEHEDIPYYSEIRWLSRGETLKRFFELRSLIAEFLESKNKCFPILNDPNWIADLAFLADITEHLNKLNLKLQGKDNLMYDMSDAVNSFKLKLEECSAQMAENNFFYFPRLKATSENQIIDLGKYCEEISLLLGQFKNRFVEINELQEKFDIFLAPFSANSRTVPLELQEELKDLKCSSPLKHAFNEATDRISFYRQLCKQKFPKLKLFAAKIVALFGSTYLCEQFFSKMKLNKSKLRNRICETNFSSLMRVATANNIKPDVNNIISAKRSSD